MTVDDDATTCRKCGTRIHITTADSNGGFCRPCEGWLTARECELPDEALQPIAADVVQRQLDAVRKQCTSRIGVTRDPANPNDYKVLTGFLSTFAQLFAKRNLPEVMLRCRDEVRDELAAQTYAIRPSDRLQWSGDGWSWVDVLLDGAITDSQLVQLVTDSYELTCDSLYDDEKKCLAVLQKNLTAEELFKQLLKSFGLSRRRAQIEEAGQRAFVIRTEPADGEIPNGCTRLGGLPDLPPGMSWPEHSSGKPLAFLAQINLSDLSEPTSLPKSGILSFFSVYGWQIEDDADPQLPDGDPETSWTQVLYHDVPPEELTRIEPPHEVNTFDPAPASLMPLMCFPSDTSEAALAGHNWKAEVQEKYLGFISTYNLACMQHLGNVTRNLLLGYADFEQKFVAEVADGDMRLLLQLGSDPHAGMCWGDGGYLYVWTPSGEPDDGRFGKLLTDYQGG